LPAPLNVSGKAEPLLKIINPLTKNLEIVGAINEVSKGKVVVIGDIELFWNGTDKIGLMDSDNLKFAEKLFNYLVKDKNKVIFKPPQKNKNKLNILYDISKGQILPDKSPGGTYEFVNFLINYGYNVDILKSDNIDYKKYDVIIENNPLEKFKTDKILSGKRFILLNDGQADLINDRETYIVLKKWCGVNYNKEDAYLPNNFIAENFGFKIMSNTVINDNKNRFFLNINFLNDKFKIYRSASIKINKDRTKCKIIGKTYSRITNNFIPIQSEGNLNFQNSPFYELKNFKENFNIIVADREVLLFADCDLLSNQILDINKHKLLLKTIVDWIDFPDKLLK
jgi:hypothetical protein